MSVILCSLMPLGPSHKPKSWVGGGLNIQTVDKMEEKNRRQMMLCPANDVES